MSRNINTYHGISRDARTCEERGGHGPTKLGEAVSVENAEEIFWGARRIRRGPLAGSQGRFLLRALPAWFDGSPCFGLEGPSVFFWGGHSGPFSYKRHPCSAQVHSLFGLMAIPILAWFNGSTNYTPYILWMNTIIPVSSETSYLVLVGGQSRADQSPNKAP